MLKNIHTNKGKGGALSMKNFELIKTYDLEILARANLHTHSLFSGCAKREMDVLSMVRRADELGLETIAVTDHFHSDTGDQRLLDYIESIKTVVAESGCRVKVLYGAELSAEIISQLNK